MRFYRSEWPSVRAHVHDVLQIPSPKAGAKPNLPIFTDRAGPQPLTFLLSILKLYYFHIFCVSTSAYTCLSLSTSVYSCLQLSIVVWISNMHSKWPHNDHHNMIIMSLLSPSCEKTYIYILVDAFPISDRRPFWAHEIPKFQSICHDPVMRTSEGLVKFRSHFELMRLQNPIYLSRSCHEDFKLASKIRQPFWAHAIPKSNLSVTILPWRLQNGW